MRIIDKNTDFYDFYQNIYRDTTVTFDRTNSFMLTKDMVCSKIKIISGNAPIVNYRFALLQVCNTFWLFSVHIEYKWNEKVSKYSVKLLKKWDNFSAKRCLILFNLISFDYSTMNHAVHLDGDSYMFKDDILANAVNNDQFRRDETLSIYAMKNSNMDLMLKNLLEESEEIFMVFYRTYKNTLITSTDLEKAFYISTGHEHFDYSKEFWKFRENCFGKSIKETVPSDIDFLCKEGYRAYAMKLFSEQNNCSLLDAKKAIDNFCKDHNYYPYDFDF